MAEINIVDFARDQLGVVFYPGQAGALQGYYNSGEPNLLLLVGRRAGKSLMAAVTAIYEAVIPEFTGLLREGETRYVIVISVRQDSAASQLRTIRKLLGHKLKKMIVSETKETITLSNNVTIMTMPASARAVRGWACSTVVMDEACFFVDSDGNQSAGAIFDALEPTTAQFGNKARVIITTSPSGPVGLVYDVFERASAGELDGWHIVKADTLSLNPRISEKVINRAYQRDPEAAASEYGAEWRQASEAFFNPDAIGRAVERRGNNEPAPGCSYVAAVDPAIMSDRYALMVGHAEGERKIIDACWLLRPPVNPNDAEQLLLDISRRYRPAVIRTDSAALVQRLQGQLPALRYEPFTRPKKLQWYGAFKEAMNLDLLTLPNDAELLGELRALRIKNGMDISAPKAGKVQHDDLADCAALIVDQLVTGGFGVSVVKDPFADWGWDDVVGTPDRVVFDTRPHPPGITYENCPRRNKGCEACVQELTAEGYFVEQDRIAEMVKGSGPQTEEQYYRELYANIGRGPDRIRQDRERIMRDEELLRKFWRDATRK